MKNRIARIVGGKNLFLRVHLVFVDQAFVSGMNFLTGLALARFLGLQGYGQYVLVYGIILFFTTFQMSFIISPMMAKGSIVEELQKVKYFSAVTTQVLLFCIFSTIIIMAGGIIAKSISFLELEKLLFPLVVATASFLAQDYFRRYLFVVNRPVAAFVNDIIGYGTNFILVLIFGITKNIDTSRALWFMAFAFFVAALSTFIQSRKLVLVLNDRSYFTEVYYDSYHFGKWLLGVNLIYWGQSQIVNYFIAGTVSVAIVGAMNACKNVLGILNVFFLGLQNILLPEASRSFNKGGTRGLKKYLRSITLLGGIITLLVVFVASVWNEFWMKLLYGSSYRGYGWIVIWWGIYFLIGFFHRPYSAGLSALDKTKRIFRSMIAGFGVFITLGYFFTSLWQVNGAMSLMCFSSLISLFLLGASFKDECNMARQLAPRRNTQFPLIVVFVFFIMMGNVPSGLAENKPVSSNDINEIYRSIVGNKPYHVSARKGSFIVNNEKWFIIGAEKPINRNLLETKEWPIKGAVYDIFIVPNPTTDDKILPKSSILHNVVKSDTIKIEACRGEYEPASFVIRTGDIELRDIEITVTNLKRKSEGKIEKSDIIDNSSVDVRIVKAWYQSGESLRKDAHGVSIPEPEPLVGNKTLTPELLLHDDKLVDANHKYQVNVIRDFTTINDKENIAPFDCESRSNKQIWMIVKAPGGSKPGDYEGTLHIKPKNTKGTSIKLALTVLPFELKPPKIYYSLYYLEGLQSSRKQKVFTYKPRSLMLRDFQDIRQHGIDNVIISQRNLDLGILRDILNIKDNAGLDRNLLFFTAWPKLTVDPGKLSKIENDVEMLVNEARVRKINKVYYYGVDELKSDFLPLERPILETIRRAGGFTMTTTTRSFLGVIDDLLDLVIFLGPPDKKIVDAVHNRNNRIWIYGNPQGGEEKPGVFRYNYGYLLWKLNVDGAAIYAYRCIMGDDPWDDFDHQKYRDHMMTYPTVDGIIPTIQWEGLREGIDDVRYLSTLYEFASESKNSKDVLEFIRTLDLSQPPHVTRQKIIRKILSLGNKES